MKLKTFLIAIAFCKCLGLLGQTTIFSENMGTPTNTTAIAANIFQNSASLTYLGSSEVRLTSASLGYTGASGSGNVFIANTIGDNFIISGINTTNYSNITLTFGQHKSTIAGSNELVVEVSTDGTLYTPLSYARATGVGTAIWTLISPTGTIPTTSNLSIRFRQTATGTGLEYRIDDVVLRGIAAPSLNPTATLLTGFTYVEGEGPSTSHTFNLSGTSLTGVAGDITISASGLDYEVSTDNITFAANRTVAYATATLTSIPIYVRLKTGLSAGTYNGQNISISGGGATIKNVTNNGSVTPPFFRSRQTGNWDTADSWESSADNITWTIASVSPSNAATATTILNTHSISISSGSVLAGNVTVASGGTLSISGGTFTLNNGLSATDLLVNGTLTYSSGTFTQGASGIAFGWGSAYNHSIVSATLMLPIATWHSNSACNITGFSASSSTSGNSTLAQTFGDFTWDCASQSGYLNIEQSDFSVAGIFTVGPSSSNLLSFGNSGGIFNNTINSIVVSGGLLDGVGGGSTTVNLTVTNSVTISGGVMNVSNGNGTANISIGTDLNLKSGRLSIINNISSPSQTIHIANDLNIRGGSLNMEFASSPSGVATINVGKDFICNSNNATAIDFGTTGTVTRNIVNIKGNFSKSGTAIFDTTSETTLPTGFSFNGTTPQTFSYSGTNSGKTHYVVQSGSNLVLNSNLTLGITTATPTSFTVSTGGTLNFGNYSIIAGNRTAPMFTSNGGATLLTTNTNGLGGTTATGSLQNFGSVGNAVNSGRVALLAGTNYTFNGATTTPFPTTFGNPATININANITSNMTSSLTVTAAFNVNNGGTFALNPTTNSLTLNNNAALTINTGGTFDNGGENQINNGAGSPTINIFGKFITKDAQGFVGTNTAIPGITPTLNLGCTIEYGFSGNQAVQGATAPTYQNISFSGGGTKTLVSTNSVAGTISILGATTFDAGNSTFGSVTSNITMTGASVYKLGGSGVKPNSGGTYTLDTTSTFEFTGSAATQIRVAPRYANVVVSGTNVKAGSTDEGGLTFQNPGSFTVKNNSIFKVTNTDGFTGSATAAIKNTSSPSIILEAGSTIEYSGANQTITALPFAHNSLTSTTTYSNLKISGTMTKSLPATEVLVNNNLDVTSSKIQIDAQRLLTVVNTINTIDEGIDVKNSGNLVQLAIVLNAATTNTGKIKMTRTSRLMHDNDYIYWGAPVKENVISQIPTSFDSIYQWDLTGEIDGAWNALSAVVPGRGFITKVTSGVTTATNFDFVGTPNNGTVHVTANGYDTNFNLNVTGNTILLANPYPCAIDAHKLIAANELVLDGNLYFWTSATANTGGNYSAGDYATWNSSGGTGTSATNDTSGNDNLRPSGKIAAGQGFFADIHADGVISFTNAMRERTTNGNSQFFKTIQATEIDGQKNRVWLNLHNEKKAFRQMLVAYIGNAKNSFDRSYDAESFTGNEINFYSIVENKNLVIQGRALPFDDDDVVPLGIAITNAGAYTIEIDEVDGLMTNKAIYLQDKFLNKIQNLSEAAYTFTTASGTFDNRFVLRYADATLATKNPKFIKNKVLVFTNEKQIKISSSIENINTVTVYDLLGKQLFIKEKINRKEFNLPHLGAKQQLLLIKLLLENGDEITKKAMF